MNGTTGFLLVLRTFFTSIAFFPAYAGDMAPSPETTSASTLDNTTGIGKDTEPSTLPGCAEGDAVGWRW